MTCRSLLSLCCLLIACSQRADARQPMDQWLVVGYGATLEDESAAIGLSYNAGRMLVYQAAYYGYLPEIQTANAGIGGRVMSGPLAAAMFLGPSVVFDGREDARAAEIAGYGNAQIMISPLERFGFGIQGVGHVSQNWSSAAVLVSLVFHVGRW